MKRPKFRLRTVMVAVALLAIAMLVPPRGPVPAKATSSDPRVAISQEQRFHGVLWGMSYDQARERAAREGRLILIFFSSVLSINCRHMEVAILPRSDVAALLSRFVTVQLPIDYCPIGILTPEECNDIALNNLELEVGLTERMSAPVFAVVDSSGQLIASFGYATPSQVIDFVKAADSSHRQVSRATWFGRWQSLTLASLLAAAATVSSLWVVRRRIRRSASRHILDLTTP
jgi:hypothetical protein